MTTLTEFVAVAVVHSSTAALSHFGVSLEPPHSAQIAPRPAAVERVVARSPKPPEKLISCPGPRAPDPAQHV
jgi:hypothetical protein